MSLPSHIDCSETQLRHSTAASIAVLSVSMNPTSDKNVARPITNSVGASKPSLRYPTRNMGRGNDNIPRSLQLRPILCLPAMDIPSESIKSKEKKREKGEKEEKGKKLVRKGRKVVLTLRNKQID
jgi:hypothetical protein